MIPVFERAKKFRALYGAATVIGEFHLSLTLIIYLLLLLSYVLSYKLTFHITGVLLVYSELCQELCTNSILLA
jgi:hypothetical protein